ncbi:MAG: branched-chain amino acid ABC transporter permease [Deltaproteobacteria bacterium]|nr:MAG: branched-chain amino acid ABC transporter permease [Deltaproteobacteria bacterium]
MTGASAQPQPADRAESAPGDAARGRTHRGIVLVALVVALALFPLLQIATGRFNYWLHMMLYAFMYVAMASSWNIIGGYAGYISLGHSAFYGIGGYATGALMTFCGISPFVSAPLAGLLCFALGLPVGLITLRTRGPAFIISTIALLMLARLALDNTESLGGADGMSLPLPDLPVQTLKLPFYYGMLAVAVAAVLASYRIRHAKLGLGLRAIAEDEVKAEAAGIPTRLYKIIAFALSALFIGIAGGLWGYYLTYLKPTVFFQILTSAQIVLMAILGGRGTVAGPVLGAILLVAADELVVAKLGSTELNITAKGVLMLVVLVMFPEGIVGTLRARGRLPRILDWG